MNKLTHRIMVIDDHPIIHDGLKTLLASESDLEISSTASSADEALKKLCSESTDIAIVDLSLGGTDGTYLIQQIRKLYPDLKILVYTMSEEKLFAERTAAAGAHGYVMKTSPPNTLKLAIRKVCSGELFFSEDMIDRIRKKLKGYSETPHTLLDTLSNREMDIFQLIGEGLDTALISERLSISRNTVDTHRINIKNKLELPNGKAVERLAYEVIQQGRMPN
ncbi:response regulator transcription factor [Pontiella agarivorans]|uniref:Response regulator transcription factor n=1 Tax=Pontiella agarivorans TaxID=3038953 RepID=A0ABU5MT80_9BACT|nr:response regulator transcription factor [Pontiella agarivorans]MDZ8117424.1 response regulator transcription factor [Pontiella agarivorans]